MSDLFHGLKPPSKPGPAQEDLRNALLDGRFQLMITLPVISPCPLLASLNDILEVQYLYADGTPVPLARFTIELVDDAPVAQGAIERDGRQKISLPKGLAYQFYFDKDGTPFAFRDAYLPVVPAITAPIPVWNAALNGKNRLHWGDPTFPHLPHDPSKPQLEWFLLHVVKETVALAGKEALQLEAARILAAMLLGSFDKVQLWNRLVVNRSRASLQTRSRLVHEFAALLLQYPVLPAPPMVCFLNSTGKGNAVDYLRLFAAELANDALKVIGHITALCAAVRLELTAIHVSIAADKWNREITQRLLGRLDEIEASIAARVRAVLEPMAQIIENATQNHPPFRYRTPAQFGTVNIYRQVQHPFPPYVPGSVDQPLTWFEAQYFYEDKAPVKQAKLYVREVGKDVAFQELDVNDDGIAFVEIPAGKNFEFRFHADQPKLAVTSPAHAPARAPAETDWALRVAASGSLVDKPLLWGPAAELTSFVDFNNNPSLRQLLRLSLIAKGSPRRELEADSLEDIAGEQTCTQLLLALLYGEKASEGDRKTWWREASFHRLRAVDDTEGFLVERLLAELHDRDDLSPVAVLEWLNSHGKGNAVVWLEELHGKLGEHRGKAAAGLQDALDAFAEDLKNIAEPIAMDKVSKANVLAAQRVRERLANLPKATDALADQWTQAGGRLRTLIDSKVSLRVFQAATPMVLQEVVQKKTPLPVRAAPPVPEPAWVKLLFLYANGDPVKLAKYKLTGGLDGDLTALGFGFENVLAVFAGDYEFKDDPNDFALLEARKLKAKDPDVGMDIVNQAIVQGKFQGPVVVRWGASQFTGDPAFLHAPSVSQIASFVALNNTPHPPTPTDHEEIAEFLQPLILGELLEAPVRESVWKHVSFHRLGGCLGEQGAVIRDLLYWLSETADPKVKDALERLNSAGSGNAYRYLTSLQSKRAAQINAVVDNIKAMLDALDVELKKLTLALDNEVTPAAKRFYKDIEERIGKVKLEVAAKVDGSLKTALDRLDAVRQQAEPEYKGPAVKMLLNVHQQKSVALEARPRAVAPEVDWIELEYRHHDDLFVEEAHYVVRNATDTGDLYTGQLQGGYAHLAVPKGLAFKYCFRRDKAFVVDPVHQTVARSVVPLAGNFLEVSIPADKLLPAAPGFFSWADCAITDQITFENAPTFGKIAHQCVLAHTQRVAWPGDEAELAKLLGPLIHKADNATGLWTAAVFYAIGSLDLPEARLIQELLFYLHVDPMGATGAGLVKRLNSAGKGNGVKFLESLRDNMPARINAVALRLNEILQAFKVECDRIGNGPPANFGPGVQSYAKLLSAAIDQLAPDVRVGEILSPLGIALTQKLLTFVPPKPVGTLLAVNLVKQEQEPPARFQPAASALKPWICLQYLHADLTPVAVAKFKLIDNLAVVTAQDDVDAQGSKYIGELDAVKTYECHFRKEAAFVIDPGKESTATALVTIAPDLTTMPQNCFSDYIATKPPYGWGPSGIDTLAEFHDEPNLAKICRIVTRRRTLFLTKAGDPKDELEMIQMLRHLILDNAHPNVRVWSIIAMNRIGTEDANGLLRRAVLLRLQFADPGPAAKDLVAMLNTAGKGHAVEWLQAVHAGLNANRDAAIQSAKDILADVAVELLKMNRVPLTNVLKARVQVLAAQATLARNNAQVQMSAVIDPLRVKLHTVCGLLPPKLFWKTAAVMNRVNVFVQPTAAFAEASPDVEVAPAWPLNQNVEVKYLYADGTPIVNATYHIETAAGASLYTATTDGTGSSTVKIIPPGTAVVKYWFENDPLVYTVKPEIRPWPNPYRALPGGYASAAAVTGILKGMPKIPDGTLTVRNQAAFLLAPTLGAMIADAVVGNSALISAAGDVQDMGAVIQNLIADPPVATTDIWFRACVNRISGIADVGSVLRGLMLFFRYMAPVSPDTLLSLMNWAGKGNAVHWLKLLNANLDAHVQTSVNSTLAVLDELRDRLEELRAHVGVLVGVKLQIAQIKARVLLARNAADAQIKAAMAPQVAALRLLLQPQALRIKFSASPMALSTHQQRIEPFLECNDTIASACKNAADQEAADRVVAAADAPLVYVIPPGSPPLPGTAAPGPPLNSLFNPARMNDRGWEALSKYKAGTRGAEAKRLAPQLSQTSKAAFPSAMEAEVGETLAHVRGLGLPPQVHVSGAWTITFGSWSGGEMWSFLHTDGSLIRYKPDGDAFMKPPSATYSIELVKEPPPPGANLAPMPLAETAFKIDGQGNPVPKGPGDFTPLDGTWIPGQLGGAGACAGVNLDEVNIHYKDHLMKSGHRPLRF